MNILFLGDIMGRTGREAVFDHLYDLREKYSADLCIANGENSAGGFGITRAVAEELTRAGVDVFTMGNHTWSKKEILYLFNEYDIVRPYNISKSEPGSGILTFTSPSGEKCAVINLIGRVYMNLPCENPFFAADEALKSIDSSIKNIIVDFHAEATSEKKALGYYLDGRVSAVFGTHTHVQTADEIILDGKTAYITDAGMCGPVTSVLGAKKEIAISRFIDDPQKSFELAGGKRELNGIFLKTDKDGKAVEIERLKL